jgi:hypothetical protein
MQIEELPTSDDDEDDIKTPDEPPAKGPIKLTAWAASASPKRTAHHMMMFPMLYNQSSSGESEESEEEFPDISDLSPAVTYRMEGSDPPVAESLLRPTVEMFLAHILGQPVITGADTFAYVYAPLFCRLYIHAFPCNHHPSVFMVSVASVTPADLFISLSGFSMGYTTLLSRYILCRMRPCLAVLTFFSASILKMSSAWKLTTREIYKR